MNFSSKILNSDEKLLQLDYGVGKLSTIFVDFSSRETSCVALQGSRVQHLVTQTEPGVREMRSNFFIVSSHAPS
jgi:hypothetical protein